MILKLPEFTFCFTIHGFLSIIGKIKLRQRLFFTADITFRRGRYGAMKKKHPILAPDVRSLNPPHRFHKTGPLPPLQAEAGKASLRIGSFNHMEMP